MIFVGSRQAFGGDRIGGVRESSLFNPRDGCQSKHERPRVSSSTAQSCRKVDNAALFEGNAKARSRSDSLGKLVPSLVEAMFTGFPGNSGEEIKITIPPEGKQQATAY